MKHKPAKRTVNKNQRLERLKRIKDSKADLESAILILRDYFNVAWTNKNFDSLNYLVGLARKAP